MFSLQLKTITFVLYFFIYKGERATVRPANASVTTDATLVVGYSEFPLATCTASGSQPTAQVSWHLGTLIDSVKVLTNTVKHLDGTYTVTSSLIGAPTVEMNQHNVQCVVRHSTLKEDLEINHKIVVHLKKKVFLCLNLTNVTVSTDSFFLWKPCLSVSAFFYAQTVIAQSVFDPPQLVSVSPLENFSSVHGYKCEADANPAANFSWHRMHQAIPDDSIKVEGNRLYFLKLTPDLSGLYICNASNEYGAGFGSLYWHIGENMGDNHSEI